jgi:hypothetical protein
VQDNSKAKLALQASVEGAARLLLQEVAVAPPKKNSVEFLQTNAPRCAFDKQARKTWVELQRKAQNHRLKVGCVRGVNQNSWYTC